MNYSIGSKNLSTELFILKTLQESKKDVEIRPVLEWENLDEEIPNATTI